MAGDCLHNLRSTLDHAIYGLALSRSWPKTPTFGDKLMFPICDTPKNFTDAVKRIGDLANEDSVRTLIESLQPYNRPNPNGHPALTLLRELNNRDKHQAISISKAATSFGHAKVTGLPAGAKVSSRAMTAGPMKHGTEVLVITLDVPGPKVNVKPNITLFPAIGHKPDHKGAAYSGIDAVLECVRDEVALIIAALRPHIKIPQRFGGISKGSDLGPGLSRSSNRLGCMERTSLSIGSGEKCGG